MLFCCCSIDFFRVQSLAEETTAKAFPFHCQLVRWFQDGCFWELIARLRATREWAAASSFRLISFETSEAPSDTSASTTSQNEFSLWSACPYLSFCIFFFLEINFARYCLPTSQTIIFSCNCLFKFCWPIERKSDVASGTRVRIVLHDQHVPTRLQVEQTQLIR